MRRSVLFFTVLLSLYTALSARIHATELYAGSPLGPVVREAVAAQLKGADKSENNYVRIIDSGDDALLLRTHMIRHATQSICVQTFIWTNDEVGRFLMYELIEAAKRGVMVRIIADQLASDKDPGIVAFLATAHPNLQLKHYRPAAGRIKPSKLQVLAKALFHFKDLNQRMHNKIMLFDDVAAITGGRNIENTYYNRSTGMNFKDRDVFVVGPVVSDIRKSFETFWDSRHAVASLDLLDVAAAVKNGSYPRFITREDFAFRDLCDNEDRLASDPVAIQRKFVDDLVRAGSVRFIADKPGKNRARWLRGKGAITSTLAGLVLDAQREIVAQSPYFVMSQSTRDVFTQLRKEKPNVKVIVSSNSFGATDNTAAYSANYKLRSFYIEDLGLSVYEYMPHPADLKKLFPAVDTFTVRAQALIEDGKQERGPFLCIHAKSAAIDERIAYIGSYNLDPRSAHLNTEVGLLIEDATVAKQLKASILNDCRPENSWVIARKKMPLSANAVNALIEGVMRLSPIDIWPIRNTSSFELLPGRAAVPPDHPAFYTHYKDLGSFPGAPPGLSSKEITTRLYKAFGGLAIPLL